MGSINVYTMILSITTLLALLPLIPGHEYYNGVCPHTPHMETFHWEQFRGQWWVAFKMSSRSSCIRYTFKQVDTTRIVVEEKLLPVLGRFGVPSAVISRGTLTPVSSNQADMWVNWETGLLREAMFSRMKYRVLDTDYKTMALVCSCQDLNIGIFTANRRSCDFLIRPTVSPPPTLPRVYSALLNQTSPDLALDMKRVRQDKCEDLGQVSLDVGFWVTQARA